jgi:excisionase family DNA binding protein
VPISSVSDEENDVAPRLLTIAEAAQRVHVSCRVVYRWIQKGELPAIRFGPRLVRLDPDDLDDYISGKRRWS